MQRCGFRVHDFLFCTEDGFCPGLPWGRRSECRLRKRSVISHEYTPNTEPLSRNPPPGPSVSGRILSACSRLKEGKAFVPSPVVVGAAQIGIIGRIYVVIEIEYNGVTVEGANLPLIKAVSYKLSNCIVAAARHCGL